MRDLPDPCETETRAGTCLSLSVALAIVLPLLVWAGGDDVAQMRLWHVHRKAGPREYGVLSGCVIRAESAEVALQMVLSCTPEQWHESWRAGKCEELTPKGQRAFIMEESTPE